MPKTIKQYLMQDIRALTLMETVEVITPTLIVCIMVLREDFSALSAVTLMAGIGWSISHFFLLSYRRMVERLIENSMKLITAAKAISNMEEVEEQKN